MSTAASLCGKILITSLFRILRLFENEHVSCFTTHTHHVGNTSRHPPLNGTTIVGEYANTVLWSTCEKTYKLVYLAL